MEKLLLTESEVQQVYGLGVVALRKMRGRGTGPRFLKVSGRLGGRAGKVLYRISDVEAWLNTVPTGGAPVPVVETERAGAK